jgi:hypothetical protein
MDKKHQEQVAVEDNLQAEQERLLFASAGRVTIDGLNCFLEETLKLRLSTENAARQLRKRGLAVVDPEGLTSLRWGRLAGQPTNC